ncbi:hypothetical protein AX17_006674 [Amanita inopinata Kibby_2008]|nr:hypothetical protein AX17_006674 [Amanita inopinata Kibby_2008]
MSISAYGETVYSPDQDNNQRIHSNKSGLSLDLEIETLGPSLRRRRPEPDAFGNTTSKTSRKQHHAQAQPSASILKPFEYSDDEDDFRDYFDFDKAWVGGTSSPLVPYSAQAASVPYKIPNPRDDQEYDDTAYKLDLGAESPSTSGYDELFHAAAQDLGNASDRLQASSSSGVGGKRLTWRSSDSENVAHGNVKKVSKSGNKASRLQWYVDMDCGICFEQAVSPRRTLCCESLFCLEHITEWLSAGTSTGLCPSCEDPCLLPPGSVNLSKSTRLSRKPIARSRSNSRSRSSSSVSANSAVSSSTSSSGSTTSTRTGTSLSSLSDKCVSEGEDVWQGSVVVVNASIAAVVRDKVRDLMRFSGGDGGMEVGDIGAGTRVVSVIGLMFILFILFR